MPVIDRFDEQLAVIDETSTSATTTHASDARTIKPRRRSSRPASRPMIVPASRPYGRPT